MTWFVAIGVLLAVLSLGLLTRPLWRRAALETAAETAPPPARSKVLPFGLAGFVCAIAAGGYAWIGTPQALNPAARMAAAAGNDGPVTREQFEAMVEGLATRLKSEPNDAEGWAMLGRSYMVVGRYDQAAPAFKQAVALNGNDAALLADYAGALASVNGRDLEGEPMRLVERALALDPNSVKALLLAGSHAFSRQDFAQALRHWEKLVRLAPDSQVAQQLQGSIDEARRLAAGGAASVSASAPAAKALAPSATSISGTVTLAPALAAKARPDDTLFVFARAAEGSRMPLAILRKQVKDLPLTFTLDDSLAMSPAARLSSAPQVVVGARISASGQATPQAGDLQGFSAVVAPGTSGLKIEISDVAGAR
jgi:cytochrome c-type biogenesis protein CcmH